MKMFIKSGNRYLKEISNRVCPVWTTKKEYALSVNDIKICQMLFDIVSAASPNEYNNDNLRIVTEGAGMKEEEYVASSREISQRRPYVVNDYKSFIYLDVLNIGNKLESFCNFDWLVVDKRNVEDNGTTIITFMPDAIDNTYVPWDVPIIKYGHILGSAPVYNKSFVSILCDKLYEIIEKRMKGNESATLVSDPETQQVVHLPTVDQMRGGYSYFSSNERRVCLKINGLSTQYWTATSTDVVPGDMPFSGGIWFVDYAGGIYYTRRTSDSYGFRPAFSLWFRTLG